MTFKMHWDALVDYDGHIEMRAGIHIIFAESEKEGIQRALHFLENGAFVEWDAFLENDTFFEDLSKYN